jgi:hypothetical protein
MKASAPEASGPAVRAEGNDEASGWDSVFVLDAAGGNSWSVFAGGFAAFTGAIAAVAGELELLAASDNGGNSVVVDPEVAGVGVGSTGAAWAGADEPGSSTEDAAGEAALAGGFGTNDSAVGCEIARLID